MSGQIVQFNTGDVIQMHTVFINDDIECEKHPNECIFSIIAWNSGIPDIGVTVSRATVTTDDTSDSECGKLMNLVHYFTSDKI